MMTPDFVFAGMPWVLAKGNELALVGGPAGGSSLAVFTDQDLAEKAAADMGAGFSPREVVSVGELDSLLSQTKARGMMIVVDPDHVMVRRYFPVDSFRDAFNKQHPA